jgi:outer membrane lipoprotein-sorting protein
MNRLSVAVCALALLVPLAASAAEDAAAIMKRSEEARRLRDVTAAGRISTKEQDGREKVKTFTWWRKLTDQGRFETLTRFTAPAEVRDEAILFLERDRDTNDVFLYLPTYKKVRRVESQSQSGSYMGTAFSYSDIANPHSEDYTHKLLRREPCPGEAAASCWVIESIPASDGVRERTGYARVVEWIHPAHYLPVKGEYYGEDGALRKRSTSARILKVDPEGGKWMAHWIAFEDLKNGRKSVLEFGEVKVNSGLPESLFTRESLKGSD